jgi:hypothetical protein
MLDERTNWHRLYAIAAFLGAGSGLLGGLGVLPSAPDWPILVSMAGGVAIGLVLAAAAHLGVTLQLRRRSRRLGA